MSKLTKKLKKTIKLLNMRLWRKCILRDIEKYKEHKRLHPNDNDWLEIYADIIGERITEYYLACKREGFSDDLENIYFHP